MHVHDRGWVAGFPLMHNDTQRLRNAARRRIACAALRRAASLDVERECPELERRFSLKAQPGLPMSTRMQCPRCARSLVAFARRPKTWSFGSAPKTWIGLHAGDEAANSTCSFHDDELSAMYAADRAGNEQHEERRAA